MHLTFKFCIMANGKKTGGRQKGTPNKDNPIKDFARSHSLSYFTPKPQVDLDGTPKKIYAYVDGAKIEIGVLADSDGNPLVMSDFDADTLALKPAERVAAELKLLEFHTPKMKAVEVDMEARVSVNTIEDRLRELCGEVDDEEDD